MKIGFFVCSNGYGHFHRTIQICEYLVDWDIDIYCYKYQVKRFHPDLPNLNFIFYDDYNIRWDLALNENEFDLNRYLKSVESQVGEIEKYDLVITDNLVSILKYRPDAIYSGSFLWYDIFRDKFGNNPLTEYEETLFQDTNPLVVCNKYVTLGSLIEHNNKFEIGWGGEDLSNESYEPETISFIVPSLNYTDDYIKKYLEIREEHKNNYNMSFNINHTDNSIFIVRPGLGIINTCVSYKIPMVCLWSENDSTETKFLADKVKEYGLGISCNVKNKVDITNVYKCRDNFSDQDINGYRDFANYLKEKE
ncbi:hypothetical protein CMI47_00080 [Candidatus Pacearchaeota archaeon]|nr:hypothetical protein [Candidatus Pacearchaeota archaeon]